MPAPRYRSRTLRRVKVKTASRVLTHYRKRKPSKPKCSECGKDLKGITRARAVALKAVAKSKKVPSRPFGDLCSNCARKKLKERARSMVW